MNDLRTPEQTGLRLRSHCVHMENRELLSVTGVTDVGCFNEREISLMTDAGALTVEGCELHIMRLDLDDGQVSVSGLVTGLFYEDEPPKKQGSLLSRMFR